MQAKEKVKSHTHHTPRVYLRRFATSDEMLMTERPGIWNAKELPISEVAVRKRFYTLDRDDGTKSDEVEDALMVLEGKVNDVFGAIDREELPLNTRLKGILAEFLGQQMARGVAYRQMGLDHLAQHEPWLRERARKGFLEHAHLLDEPPEDLDAAATQYAETYDIARFATQDAIVRRGIATGIGLTNALVNTCWTVVRFDKPALLGSDQPVVCWFAPQRSSPWGPTSAIELRVPISSTQALVASWHDRGDTPYVVSGDALAAMSINYHTAKQGAEWVFWRPGTSPRRGQPLHDNAILGSPSTNSQRREATRRLIERILETREDKITVFTPKPR